MEGNSYPLSLCNLILEFMMNYGFVQMINTPTRGRNILDVFFTNRPSLVVSCDVLSGISDHEIVCILSKISATYLQDSRRHKMTSTRFGPPWLTNNIKRLSKKKQRWYNIARSTNLERDWALYQKLKSETQQACHKSYNGYLSTLLDRNNNCTKRFWSFIKSKRTDQMGINTLQSQGISYTDSVAKANILNKQFSSVFTREDLSSIPEIRGEPIPDIPPLHIEIEGVKHLLESIESRQSYGA